ncbi:MAG TPA: hypothetical protein GX526_03610 [Thermoanaerobacterales bacterium]|jgi:hypothetical protein|nr:hypothetical protein [Thermoanaerobacterales bacterium]
MPNGGIPNELYTERKITSKIDKTLRIGVDIAKVIHYAGAFVYRGIELAKALDLIILGKAWKPLGIVNQLGKKRIKVVA